MKELHNAFTKKGFNYSHGCMGSNSWMGVVYYTYYSVKN